MSKEYHEVGLSLSEGELTMVADRKVFEETVSAIEAMLELETEGAYSSIRIKGQAQPVYLKFKLVD